MNYLPIVLRGDNFPQINFKKLAANRNKKLYLFLNFVKNIIGLFTKKPNKIEIGAKQNAFRRRKGSKSTSFSKERI